ncbi:MAG: FAD-binding oxidoreductase [Thermodesulfobacteriota bacterium]
MLANDGLSRIVGSDNILENPEILEQYARDLSLVHRVRPRCVARPGNAGEVQAIVKWANETATPLVPVSSGPPHFRGDTLPRVGGSIVVDLTRMNKIVRIDPRNRVAMVEPGVTFAELCPELEAQGLSPYMPLCPRSSKSVLASMLEKEPVTMPAHHWDCTDPFLCGEIIFGTGDILRSGEAAGPDSTEEKWKIGNCQMTPFGLSQFDENKLISGAQGTIGIITWGTLKCRLASGFSRTFLVPSEEVSPLFEIVYRLLRSRQCDHCFILNDLNLACLLAPESGEIKRLRETLPAWVLVVSFEGNGDLPEEKVAWQEADFRDMVLLTGHLKPALQIPGADGEDLSRVLSRPSDEPYWKVRYKGACSDVFFLTTLDRTPGFIGAISNMSQSRRFPQKDIGVYIQPVVQGTSCHCEFDLFHDPADSAETARVNWLLGEGATNLANMGAFFSRPYGPWAKIAYSRAAQTAAMLKKVKKIFDPKDILNPGQLCF